MMRECLAIIMCVLVEKRSISQRHTNDLTLRAVWLNYIMFSQLNLQGCNIAYVGNEARALLRDF